MKFIIDSKLQVTSFILCSLAILLVGLTGCSESKDENASKVKGQVKESLSIAVSKTPLSAPFYVAYAKGFFHAQGLEVTLVDTVGGHRCLQAVFDGEVEMGTVSDYPIMMNSFKRKDFSIVTTFVSSENDVKLIGRKSLGVTQVANLQGKKIGTVTGASSHYFLDRFLLFNGMEINDVKVVHVSAENMTMALKNGDVDALSAWEPFGYLSQKQLGDDAVIFPRSTYYRETFNLVTTNNYVKQSTKKIKKLLIALDQAVTFMHEQPSEAQSILVERLKLDNKFIDWVWGDFDFKLSLDQSLILTLENEGRWAMENNLVSGDKLPNYLNYIYFDVMNAVDADAVTISH